jgi:hypothetical protein
MGLLLRGPLLGDTGVGQRRVLGFFLPALTALLGGSELTGCHAEAPADGVRGLLEASPGAAHLGHALRDALDPLHLER